MSDLEYVNLLVRNHLYLLPENQHIANKWRVKESSIEGRGILAIQDIPVDDLVFVDHPLIMGPRTSEGSFTGCIVCYKTDDSLRVCQKGCGLLVCSEKCEENISHMGECELIKSWKKRSASDELESVKFIRNIVPLRGICLDKEKKDFVLTLIHHSSPKHGREVNFLKEHFEFSKNDENFMFRTCCVLDANAYEMILTNERNENVNLRGLFPVSALMNHSCRPNVRTDFDAKGRMYVRASRPISVGEEICTSYTGLLWGTTARRHHLKSTKDFLCACERCSDKTEFKTYLGGLKCLDKKCTGIILPSDPLELLSEWCCEVCGLKVSVRQIGAMQSAIGGCLSNLKLNSPDDMYEFLTQKINSILPNTNHIVLELKWKLISNCNGKGSLRWNKLNTDWLNRIETLCRELLLPYESLGLQRASQCARIQLALHRCLLRKLKNKYGNPDAKEDALENICELEREVASSINESFRVLKYDIFSPKDLETRKDLANSDMRKLIQYDDNEL